jgi:L-ribulose-5-phosphate 3-epimerase
VRISFGTTNYVAREVGFERGHGWEKADRITNERFCPLDTFRERFGDLLSAVRGLGFDAVDLWTAHLNGAWATGEHYAIASELLREHDLRVTQIMGDFPTPESVLQAAEAAAAVGATVVGGIVDVAPADLAALAPTLRERGVRVGFENHDGASPEEVLGLIEAVGEDVVGATVDTGWYGAANYDPARAIEVLDGHILAVHIKDVPALDAHTSCAWGEGIVPVRRCAERLRELGYDGVFMVDHEPFDHDPSEECRRMLAAARDWLEG